MWQFPLWLGLPSAPSPLASPLLVARHSYVAALVDSALAAGVVQGTLTRDNAKPMPGAKIELVAADGTIYNTKTDSRGNFSFADIPPGVYTISFNKGSWPTGSATFEMPANGGVNIQANLGGAGPVITIVPIPY